MNKPTLAPVLKTAFQDRIEKGLDFGSFTFTELQLAAEAQHQHAQEYYNSLTECPLRAVAEDLARYFDALEELRVDALDRWPTVEDWAEYWANTYLEGRA